MKGKVVDKVVMEVHLLGNTLSSRSTRHHTKVTETVHNCCHTLCIHMYICTYVDVILFMYVCMHVLENDLQGVSDHTHVRISQCVYVHKMYVCMYEQVLYVTVCG